MKFLQNERLSACGGDLVSMMTHRQICKRSFKYFTTKYGQGIQAVKVNKEYFCVDYNNLRPGGLSLLFFPKFLVDCDSLPVL